MCYGEFLDPYLTKLLYISLVRPILEYVSIIWNPYYRRHIDSIESVQKQFLLFYLSGLGWDYANGFPSYKARLGLIDLNFKLWKVEGLFKEFVLFLI